jgi:oligoendopeptidase F
LVKVALSRSEVPVELTWDLASIYPSDGAWEEAFDAVEGLLPALRAAEGSLGTSGRHLFDGLTLLYSSYEQLERLSAYAHHHHDEDMAHEGYTALADRVTTLVTAFAEATAFITPEILAIDADVLERFFVEAPELGTYRHTIDEITAERAHTRSTEVEQLLAGAAEIAEGPRRAYEALHNLDRLFPTIVDADGTAVELTNGTYQRFLRGEDRRVRVAAFEGMLGTFKLQEHAQAAILGTQVKKNIFYARARCHDSSLAAALFSTHIPTAVYHTLIDAVHANLPTLHRYLALRARILNLGEPLHMYDLYAPLVKDVDAEVTYQQACEQAVTALAPLGEAYTSVVKHGLVSRWVDVAETKGKLTGAYSGGAYGTHPFILLNYQARRDDMFTLAHELGHSLHSYLSAETQPYHYAHYGIFLAEIASTLNEALLRHHLLRTTDDRRIRASIVNQHLENVRTTVFRQAMFAEFELRVHEHAERGDALTVEAIRTIYRALVDRYYGSGGVVIDDLIEWEWTIVPHFYTSFYVFQYATGFAASAALADKILVEGQPAVDRYLRMLRSGSSKYPIDLLKEAGIDMTTSAPIDATMAEFDRLVTELASLV